MLMAGLVLMTLTSSLPAHATAPSGLPQSSLTLPVSVQLPSLKAAAEVFHR